MCPRSRVCFFQRCLLRATSCCSKVGSVARIQKIICFVRLITDHPIIRYILGSWQLLQTGRWQCRSRGSYPGGNFIIWGASMAYSGRPSISSWSGCTASVTRKPRFQRHRSPMRIHRNTEKLNSSQAFSWEPDRSHPCFSKWMAKWTNEWTQSANEFQFCVCQKPGWTCILVGDFYAFTIYKFKWKFLKFAHSLCLLWLYPPTKREI